MAVQMQLNGLCDELILNGFVECVSCGMKELRNARDMDDLRISKEKVSSGTAPITANCLSEAIKVRNESTQKLIIGRREKSVEHSVSDR